MNGAANRNIKPTTMTIAIRISECLEAKERKKNKNREHQEPIERFDSATLSMLGGVFVTVCIFVMPLIYRCREKIASVDERCIK